MSNIDFFPFAVSAKITENRFDMNSDGHFQNSDRAEQYALMLLQSGDYHSVVVVDQRDNMTTTLLRAMVEA